MSSTDESRKFKHGDHEVAFPDLVRYLEAVGMKAECPNCGFDGWNVVTSGRNESGEELITVTKIDSAYDHSFRPAFAMYCIKCASIRTILGSPVMKWLKDNPRGDN